MAMLVITRWYNPMFALFPFLLVSPTGSNLEDVFFHATTVPGDVMCTLCLHVICPFVEL